MLRLALKTVWNERAKFAGAVVGVGLGICLAIFQTGMYFGFLNDTTNVIDAVDADVWIVPHNQPTFDGFAQLDDLVFWQARRVPGVDGAIRVVWGDAFCRMPQTGGHDYMQIFGVDPVGDWASQFALTQPVSLQTLRQPGNILVSRRDRNKLELDRRPDAPLEIGGRRARVVGTVEQIRLFSTAAFVLTDLDNARAFLHLPENRVTYVACRVVPGAQRDAVVAALQRRFPEYEVLDGPTFRRRCSKYWETNSGIGPVILMSGVLGILIGSLVAGFTFYLSISEKLRTLACFKALGASGGDLAWLVGGQMGIVFLLGALVSIAPTVGALGWAERLNITMSITPAQVGGCLAMTALALAIGGWTSVRVLARLEPAEAFRR